MVGAMAGAVNSTEDGDQLGPGDAPPVDGTHNRDGLDETITTSSSVSSRLGVPSASTSHRTSLQGTGLGPINPPPIARPFKSETKWLEESEVGYLHGDLHDGIYLKGGHSLLRWDATAGVPVEHTLVDCNLFETRKLLDTCLKSPLTPIMQSVLINTLLKNSKLIVLVGKSRVSAETFQKMITKNPPVAAAALIATGKQSLGSKVTKLPRLLEILIDTLHVSPQSAMEVVQKVFEIERDEERKNKNKIQNTFPKEFVKAFIAACVSGGGGGGGVGSITQQTKVTCMFLQGMLKQKFIGLVDLPYEVFSFCVENVSVKQAGDLFRVLKSMEQENGAVSGS